MCLPPFSFHCLHSFHLCGMKPMFQAKCCWIETTEHREEITTVLNTGMMSLEWLVH